MRNGNRPHRRSDRPSDRAADRALERARELERRASVLAEAATRARVFVSMPVVPGVTPRILLDPERSTVHGDDALFERRHGTFALDEIGLPCFDHLVLYGDGCFEGILIPGGRIFLLKEHIERLWASARALEIEIPYSKTELVHHLVESAREVDFSSSGAGYIRLVVSRGLGDLGINPHVDHPPLSARDVRDRHRDRARAAHPPRRCLGAGSADQEQQLPQQRARAHRGDAGKRHPRGADADPRRLRGGGDGGQRAIPAGSRTRPASRC
jgi:hypothetical protein